MHHENTMHWGIHFITCRPPEICENGKMRSGRWQGSCAYKWHVGKPRCTNTLSFQHDYAVAEAMVLGRLQHWLNMGYWAQDNIGHGQYWAPAADVPDDQALIDARHDDHPDPLGFAGPVEAAAGAVAPVAVAAADGESDSSSSSASSCSDSADSDSS